MPFKDPVKARAEARKRGRLYYRNQSQVEKAAALTYYGPNGALMCSHGGCGVTDLDMLTLDHIDNSGGKARRAGCSGGFRLYRKLRLQEYPEGYQTLCWNHNLKKEALRRRGEELAWPEQQ